MVININDCDLNSDYFHFSNKENVYSILNNGLIPASGPASKLVGDRPNVSVSQGGKGIMGIVDSFIYMFSTEIKTSEIPEEYQKYFCEIEDFKSSGLIDKDVVCKAMCRKLKDEVYFRVVLDEEQLKQANIGGLTGYDINLPMAIDKSKLNIITDSNNNVLSAYDVSLYIYQNAKNVDAFRTMHDNFFYMFETIGPVDITDYSVSGKRR